MDLQKLVEGLLVLPEPQKQLVWNRQLPEWTRANAVPVVKSQLAPFVSQAALDQTGTHPIPVVPVQGVVEPEASLPQPPEEVLAPDHTAASVMGGPWLYLAGAAFVAILAFVLWTTWPRDAQAPTDTPGASPGLTTPAGTSGASSPDTSGTTPPPTSGETVETQPGSGETVETQPGSGPTQTAGLTRPSNLETDLPRSELPKLRGVAAWSGTSLTLTLYNGTSFRVTEVFVRLSHLEEDEFVDAVALSRLVPPSGEMDAGVSGMLDRVAPDRKKPGVNPLDTGPLEAEVGPRPKVYRWRIEGARGYAFRPSSS